jgi:hypothetical protein
VFVSFQNDSGIRFSAHFYNPASDKVETRPVSGWVTSDDGISQATILVPDQGLQLRVGQIQGFLAVIPNGQETEHQELIDAKVAALKKAIAEKSTDVSTSLAS